MKDLVSVCIATYNGSKYLQQQLDSLVEQSYSNIEVILQDDCSCDETLAIANLYKKRLKIQIYQNENNLGYIKNFESLLQKANGSFIAICDQDDIWERDKLKILMENIKENILIYSNSELIDKDGKSLNKTLSQKLKNNFIDSSTALNFLYDNSVSAHAMLFKKTLLQHIFPFPEHIYFDAWIAATASSLGSITYCDKSLVKYRQHETNTLSKHKRSPQKSTKALKKEQNVKELLLKIDEMFLMPTLKESEKEILRNLKKYYKDFASSYFNGKMFLFIYKNRKLFFKITKKNRILLSLKSAIGKKLYQVAPFL